MTRPYAEVIGDPIAQSKSPTIHNFWLAKTGIDAEYRACHVAPDGLADYLTERRVTSITGQPLSANIRRAYCTSLVTRSAST